MKNVLVTGGTVFISRYVAEYYVQKGWNVYTLNRNSRPQPDHVTLIQADRNNLGDILKKYHFDIVFDITAYNGANIDLLLDALGSYDDYIMISSSAVYPEYEKQPFSEDSPVGENRYWGKYGTDKIEAERALLKRNPNAYILRPPYLYGEMNNVYREAFVFECALNDRKFYLPNNGRMNLQFFHVEDLCRFMDIILQKKPKQHIFNVGNQEVISVADWVTLCYRLLGKQAEFINVVSDIDQRNYFSFYNYEYCLDVQSQNTFMSTTKPLEEGLKASLDWYLKNTDAVRRKPFIEYIDNNLIDSHRVSNF